MTVIVVKRGKEGVFEMAGDSMATSWHHREDETKKTVKVFKQEYADNTHLLIGATGSCEQAGLMNLFIRGNFIEDFNNEKEVINWLEKFYIFIREKDNRLNSLDNQWLLAKGDKCYFCHNYYVAEVKEFEAMGCGRDYALGALEMGADIEKAVEVACKYSPFCSEPITKI